LNAPVVGIAATSDSGGYWLAAADGGVFTFGDAPFYGSRGGDFISAPVVGIAPNSVRGASGYVIASSDGSCFLFTSDSDGVDFSFTQSVVGIVPTDSPAPS
jgi:hypothetical protein